MKTEPAVAAQDQQKESPAGDKRNDILLFVDENMPELKTASDDEKIAAALDLLNRNKEFHSKMESLFEKEPLIGNLLGSVMKGDNGFINALAETLSPEEYAKLLEDSGSDVIESRNSRLEKLKQLEDTDAELQARIEESGKNIEQWLDSKQDWDDAKKEDFYKRITSFLEVLADGKLTNAEMDQLSNMIYFDDMIKSAREEGALSGRNEKISDKRIREEAEKTTDGLPQIPGGAAGSEEEKAVINNPLGDVIEMKEKRVKF
jgi:hypothetical protein